MLDPSATPDPAAPTRQISHELVLWGGFALCLLVAALSVVMPELSGGDVPDNRPTPPLAPQAPKAR